MPAAAAVLSAQLERDATAAAAAGTDSAAGRLISLASEIDRYTGVP
jgi:hypothetical protein